MKRIVILLVFLLLTLTSISFAEKDPVNMGFGLGMNSGMYGINFDTKINVNSIFNLSDPGIKIGAFYADSNNLGTALPQRKFLGLDINGMFYLTRNIYLGAGFNYPLKITGGLLGDFGSQIFIGSDMKFGSGEFFMELGYGETRVQGYDQYKGTSALLGYRFFYGDQSNVPALPAEVNASTQESTGRIDKKYAIQAGGFTVKANAEAFCSRMRSDGFEPILVKKGDVFVVYGGQADTLKDAENIRSLLASKNYGPMIIEFIKPETVEKPSVAVAAPVKKFRVQAGIFWFTKSAQTLYDKLVSEGFDAKMEAIGDKFVVFGGDADSADNAKALKEKLKEKGFDSIVKEMQ